MKIKLTTVSLFFFLLPLFSAQAGPALNNSSGYDQDTTNSEPVLVAFLEDMLDAPKRKPKTKYTTDIELIKKKAEKGDIYYQALLGAAYRRGYFTDKDLKEALKWLEMSAKGGHPIAIYNLAQMYEDGVEVKKDQNKAEELYSLAYPGLKRLAAKGDPEAEFDLGWMYLDGVGVVKNKGESNKWIHKAAFHGNAIAQNRLGIMYQNGKGVARNMNSSVRWYKKASAQGYHWGQANLGILFESGKGVNKNPRKAMKLYRRAAKQGNLWAVKRIAIMYEKGIGVKKNYAMATKWYLKASKQGSEEAKKKLETLFESGLAPAFIVKEPLPTPGEWETIPIDVNPTFKLRYRVLLSNSKIKKYGVAGLLDVKAKGEQLLLKLEKSIMLADFKELQTQTPDFATLGQLKNFSFSNGSFWKGNRLITWGRLGKKLAVINPVEISEQPLWVLESVIPLKITRKDLGEWLFKDKILANPKNDEIAAHMYSSKKDHLVEVPGIISTGNSFIKHASFIEGFNFTWNYPIDPRAMTKWERNAFFKLLKASIPVFPHIHYAKFTKKGLTYTYSPLSLPFPIESGIDSDALSLFPTYFMERPRLANNTLGDARLIGRILNQLDTHYRAISHDGRYAMGKRVIDEMLIDLRHKGPDGLLPTVSIDSDHELGSLFDRMFDPSDSKHFFALSSFKGLIEVYLPDRLDEMFALMGGFPLRDSFHPRSKLFKMQEAQYEKALNKLTEQARVGPYIKGTEDFMSNLLDSDYWDGKEAVKNKVFSQWLELQDLEKSLRTRVLAKRAIAIYQSGFPEKGIQMFREALDGGTEVLYEKEFGHELRKNKMFTLAGELYLKAHTIQKSKSADMKNLPDQFWETLFKYAFTACDAGQPALASSAIEYVNDFTAQNNIDLSPKWNDYMVTLEALVLALYDKLDLAYGKMLDHSGFDKWVVRRIKNDPARFAPLYTNPDKLAMVLGIDLGDLKNANPLTTPQFYPDLEGQLVLQSPLNRSWKGVLSRNPRP